MSAVLDPPAQISFRGDDAQAILDANPEVRQAVLESAATMPGTKIDVYVSPRITPEGPLEWSLSLTSTFGRRSFTVTQRKPQGAVRFFND